MTPEREQHISDINYDIAKGLSKEGCYRLVKRNSPTTATYRSSYELWKSKVRYNYVVKRGVKKAMLERDDLTRWDYVKIFFL